MDRDYIKDSIMQRYEKHFFEVLHSFYRRSLFRNLHTNRTAVVCLTAHWYCL